MDTETEAGARLLAAATSTTATISIEVPLTADAKLLLYELRYGSWDTLTNKEPPPTTINPNLSRRTEELDVTVRLANCLDNADVVYVWQACERSDAEWLRVKNTSRKTVKELKEILAELGLHLGMHDEIASIKHLLPAPPIEPTT